MRYKIVRITALLTVVFMTAAAFAQTRAKEQTTVMAMRSPMPQPASVRSQESQSD